MSHLKEQLTEDFKTAMKEKQVIAKDTLQTCRAAILKVEKDQKIQLDDPQIIDILRKEYNKRRDTITEIGTTRPDIVDKYQQEMDVIAKYLPKLLSEEEIETLVRETIAEVEAIGPKDMGKLMKVLVPKTKGKADGKLVNEVVKKLLS